MTPGSGFISDAKGKFIFKEVYIIIVAWDVQLPEQIAKEWLQWENLPQKVAVPRCLTGQQEQIEEIELHAFGGASCKGSGGCRVFHCETTIRREHWTGGRKSTFNQTRPHHTPPGASDYPVSGHSVP